MTEIITHIGPDGVLNVRLPREFVDSDVIIHVSRARADAKRIAEIEDPRERARAWKEFVEENAGSIQDPTFERHAQGDYEIRDDL
jgi:hypothetical protein